MIEQRVAPELLIQELTLCVFVYKESYHELVNIGEYWCFDPGISDSEIGIDFLIFEKKISKEKSILKQLLKIFDNSSWR